MQTSKIATRISRKIKTTSKSTGPQTIGTKADCWGE